MTTQKNICGSLLVKGILFLTGKQWCCFLKMVYNWFRNVGLNHMKRSYKECKAIKPFICSATSAKNSFHKLQEDKWETEHMRLNTTHIWQPKQKAIGNILHISKTVQPLLNMLCWDNFTLRTTWHVYSIDNCLLFWSRLIHPFLFYFVDGDHLGNFWYISVSKAVYVGACCRDRIFYYLLFRYFPFLSYTVLPVHPFKCGSMFSLIWSHMWILWPHWRGQACGTTHRLNSSHMTMLFTSGPIDCDNKGCKMHTWT